MAVKNLKAMSHETIDGNFFSQIKIDVFASPRLRSTYLFHRYSSISRASWEKLVHPRQTNTNYIIV